MNYNIVLNPKREDINKIKELDKKFYKDEYLWDNEYQNSIYEKNKETFILIKDSVKLIGYLNYLCITKETYLKMKESNITIDEFNLNEIVPFVKGDNYITINSIVIDRKYQNSNIIKEINDAFLLKLQQLNEREIEIYGINGIAISRDGQKYFESLGFSKYKELEDGNNLYIIEKDVTEKIKNAISLLKNKEK